MSGIGPSRLFAGGLRWDPQRTQGKAVSLGRMVAGEGSLGSLPNLTMAPSRAGARLLRPRDPNVERPRLRPDPADLARERHVELLGVRIEAGEIVEAAPVAHVADADEA